MDLECDSGVTSPCALFCTCSDPNCDFREKNAIHEWRWDNTFAAATLELSEHDLEVKFHPVFSAGTAVVRGNSLMEKGRHHFWEIMMITSVYGTDMMVGVATDKVDLTGTNGTYCSLLGRDKESWGFSYMGYIQHNGEKHTYSSGFGQGSAVGIHLDTWKGTLEFYLNKKPLGIAFTGLQDMDLYPMACSTAAKSRMRITHCCSVPASLQIECLAKLKPAQRAYLTAAFPGLRYLSQSIFAYILQRQLYITDEDELEFPAEFTILDDFDFALIGFGRRKKKKALENYASN